MFKEFKAFVNQGNAMDLAVGVIIGAAFGKIVASIVNDVVMPLLSVVIGSVDFKTLSIKLSGGAVVAYGMLLQNVFEFLVIAFTIFLVVRQLNKWRGEAKPAK